MRFIGSCPLVFVSAAIVVGIVLDRYGVTSGSGVSLWLGGAWCAWIGWLVTWRAGWWRGSALCLLAVGCSLAGAWHHTYWNEFPVADLGFIAGTLPSPVRLRGTVVTSPEYSPLRPSDPLATIPQGVSSSFLLRANQCNREGEFYGISGLVQVTVDGHVLGVAAGDTVELLGMLQRSSFAANPGQFDRAQKDRARRVLARLNVGFPECVTRLDTQQRRAGISWIVATRAAGERLLDRYVGPARGDLAAAMLLGARERVAGDRVQAFFETGTIHLLAISGLHVGMLAYFFFFAARQSTADPRMVLWSMILLTLFYAIVTGLRAPVMRATVLIHLVCYGWYWHRAAVAWNSLAAAAIVVLVIRPTELFEPGTQLSFLAVAGLAWLAGQKRGVPQDPLDRLVWRSRSWLFRFAHTAWRKATGLFVASALIWTITLPLVVHQFHLVTPLAVPLNVVLTVPVAIALLSGFVVLTCGWALPSVAWLFGCICDASLALIEQIVASVQAWPGSHFWCGGFSAWWVGSFYLLLFVSASRGADHSGRRWLALAWAFWLVASLGLPRFIATDQSLRCTLLSVGHGTAAVLEMPGGAVLLYDAGRLGVPEPGVEIISRFLWSRGIRRIDGVILTHADADHYNALPGLLQRFSVTTVYTSPLMFRESAPGLDRLQRSLAEATATSIVHLQAGDRIPVDAPGCSVEVLHPPPEGVAGSDNANSLVVGVRCGIRSILLPGDLEAEGLQQLLGAAEWDCDVAMSPHHGSAQASQAEFAEWCRPEVLIVSGDARSVGMQIPYDWPFVPQKLFHTARDGAVTVILHRNRFGVRTHCSSDEYLSDLHLP